MAASLTLDESTLGSGELSHAHSWEQIAGEHNYPRLMAQWSSAPKSLPTCYLFPSSNEDEERYGFVYVCSVPLCNSRVHLVTVMVT